MQNQWFALFLHDRTNNYQLLLQDDAEKTARRYDHGISVYAADKNAEIQVQQIHSVLAEVKSRRPAAILVSPVRESSLLGVITEAAIQGIPWIYLCRWSDTVHTVRRDYPNYTAFSVAADQSQIGRLQGQILKRLFGSREELVYIQGPQGTSSVSRRHTALQRELAAWPNLRWSPYNTDWSTEGGAAAMRSWLATFRRGKLPEFVVCAQNDDMALGARQAIIEGGHVLRPDKLTIVGCDGLPTFGQRLVAEGQLAATIVVPPVSGRAIEEFMRTSLLKRPAPAEVSVEVECFPLLEQLDRLVTATEAPTNAVRVAASRSVTNMHRVLASSNPEPRDSFMPTNNDAIVAAALKEVAATSRKATSTRSTFQDRPLPSGDTTRAPVSSSEHEPRTGGAVASSRAANSRIRGSIPDKTTGTGGPASAPTPSIRTTNSPRR